MLLGGGAVIVIFLGSLLVDVLIVPTSPVAHSATVRWLHSVADPVVAVLVSAVRVDTRFNGTQIMPLIIACVVLGLTTFLNTRMHNLIEWVEEKEEARDVQTRRMQRKLAQETGAAVGSKPKGLLGGLFHSERKQQEELVKAKQQLEKFRKKLAFMSVEIVDSAKMKEGRDPLLTDRLFQEFRGLLESVLKQQRQRACSWAPDGATACFLQAEVACNAAKSVLRALADFNRKKNPLDVPMQVRCGVHVGEVLYDDTTPLEMLSDRVLDVTAALRKAAPPNSMLVSQTVYEQIRDKSGFGGLGAEVEGYSVLEWSLEPRPAAAPAVQGQVAAAVAGTAAAMNLFPSSLETAIGPNDTTLGPGMAGALRAGSAQRIGRYEVMAELGRGGMGVVYKARDTQIGRIVAIKMILTANVPPQYLDRYKQRFFREAQSAGIMSHPNIVTIYDIAEHESGQPYLVMEFIEGDTLEKLLTPPLEGPGGVRMPVERALDIIIQMCEALDCAHTRGVIHRDIKPANILCTVDGKAKLADFGIAKLEGAQFTQAGTVLGTPAFMSPEQCGGHAVDQRSDLFSLGAVLYFMLTGELPFPGKTVTAIMFKLIHSDPVPARELNANVSKDIDVVLSRCLAKRPDDRYTTARELADDLRAVLAGRQPSSRSESKSTDVDETTMGNAAM